MVFPLTSIELDRITPNTSVIVKVPLSIGPSPLTVMTILPFSPTYPLKLNPFTLVLYKLDFNVIVPLLPLSSVLPSYTTV